MDCNKLQKMLELRVGAMTLEPDEKKHLEACPDCQKVYDELVSFENDLKDFEFEPLSANEFALFQQKLDNRINHYQRKAISFYGLFTRYGTAMAAAVFLFFVSLWSGLEYEVYYTDNTVLENSYYLADNSTTDQYSEDESISDEYIELLLSDYTNLSGFDSGSQLLGELTSEEYEYLEKNWDLGEIL